MTRIVKLENVDKRVTAALAAAGIHTVADLWMEIGADYPTGVKNLEKTATADQLAEILVAGARDPVPSPGKWNWFTFQLRHCWKELLAVVMTLILVALLAINIAGRLDTMVVMNGNGLPAFHVIDGSELRRAKMFRVHGSFASAEEAKGRYVITPVNEGDVLLEKQLGSKELKGQLTGRPTLTLSLPTGAIRSELTVGNHVTLVFQQKAGTKPATPVSLTEVSIRDVIVLAVNREPNASSLTVAVQNQTDLAKVIELSAVGDAIIVE